MTLLIPWINILGIFSTVSFCLDLMVRSLPLFPSPSFHHDVRTSAKVGFLFFCHISHFPSSHRPRFINFFPTPSFHHPPFTTFPPPSFHYHPSITLLSLPSFHQSYSTSLFVIATHSLAWKGGDRSWWLHSKVKLPWLVHGSPEGKVSARRHDADEEP